MKPVVFGKFTLLRRLARGGMADLFLARSSGVAGVERMVAIKLISSRFVSDADLVAMFQDEARIASTLDHPNIGQVFEVGELNDQYYLVMEYLHGKDLRSIAETLATRAVTRVPTEIAVYIGVKMCGALQCAHETRGLDGSPLNIIHRDVSPSNIMVTYQGNVKLLDFGIAKAANRSTKTQPGCIKGKLRYLSPEQLLGATIDHRTDIFTLGTSLWEATVGRQLFEGEREFEIFDAISGGQVPAPSSLWPDYPAGLEKILLRALATHADDRYQTAQEMHGDLVAFAQHSGFVLSELGVANFMRHTFTDECLAWDAAQLRGQSLLDHLLDTATDEEKENESLLDSADDLATIPPPEEKAAQRSVQPKDPMACATIDAAARVAAGDTASGEPAAVAREPVPSGEGGQRKTVFFGSGTIGQPPTAEQSPRKTMMFGQQAPPPASTPAARAKPQTSSVGPITLGRGDGAARHGAAATPSHPPAEHPPPSATPVNIAAKSGRHVAITPDGRAAILEGPRSTGLMAAMDSTPTAAPGAHWAGHDVAEPRPPGPRTPAPAALSSRPATTPEGGALDERTRRDVRPPTGDWAHQAAASGRRPGTHPYFKEEKPLAFGQVPTAAQRSGPRPLRVALAAGLALLVAAGALGMWLWHRPDQQQLAQQQQRAQQRESARSASRAATQRPTIRITSEPSGAIVFSATTGQELGRTPLRVTSPDQKTTKVELHLKGYQLTSLMIGADDDDHHVKLRPSVKK